LEAKIVQLMAIIEKQSARIAALEEQVRRSSSNSSKPPSVDGPEHKPKRQRKSSGRKPGGQPGHQRNMRVLEPTAKAAKVVPCIPEHCEKCKRKLHGRDLSPQRHQVFELPKFEPTFDEYQLHAIGCGCGHVTRGKLPPDVPRGAFGPGVVAVVALLMGVYRLSKRMVPDLMLDVFNLRMSVGAVVGCQQLASEAVAASVDEAKEHVIEQPIKYADETGWREGSKRTRAWLWTASTRSVVVFMVHPRRNADAAKALLVKAAGILVSDRYGAYSWWPDRLRQLCWAHINRDMLAIAERGGQSEFVGKSLMEEIERMFHWWHSVRDGTLKRRSFEVYMRSLRIRFEAVLDVGKASDHPKTAKTCANLLKHACSLWTFVRVAGVEPTNNSAEQAIRHAVILRKISYGTHSKMGSRFIERILTVHGTLRRQQRNILIFLRDACTAKLHHAGSPSLLPLMVLHSQLAEVV